MSAWVVDTGGVHITGDFQDEAGYPNGDWDPGTTPMAQEASDTNIYSVIVDIPAHRIYEFKFVNGIHGYQQEFVPVESRVNYNFIDNRWIYIDSLANDTFDLGAIRFSGNAPAGKSLLRFYVDMQNETVNANGAHVAGDFQAWNTNGSHLHSFDGMVYEYIAYIDSGLSTVHEFKFLNGNASGDYEALASWCVNGNGNRTIAAPRDTMLPVVCYTFCAACATLGMDEVTASSFQLVPNPAEDLVTIGFNVRGDWSVSVSDMAGREVENMTYPESSSAQIETSGFVPGVYFVRVMNASGQVQIQKLVIR